MRRTRRWLAGRKMSWPLDWSALCLSEGLVVGIGGARARLGRRGRSRRGGRARSARNVEGNDGTGELGGRGTGRARRGRLRRRLLPLGLDVEGIEGSGRGRKRGRLGSNRGLVCLKRRPRRTGGRRTRRRGRLRGSTGDNNLTGGRLDAIGAEGDLRGGCGTGELGDGRSRFVGPRSSARHWRMDQRK